MKPFFDRCTFSHQMVVTASTVMELTSVFNWGVTEWSFNPRWLLIDEQNIQYTSKDANGIMIKKKNS